MMKIIVLFLLVFISITLGKNAAKKFNCDENSFLWGCAFGASVEFLTMCYACLF